MASLRNGEPLRLTILEAYRDEIERGITRMLAGEGPLRSLLRYHVGIENEHGQPDRANGKHLRPSLVLFVADHLGDAVDRALPSAVGLELVHAFSLIHDDIQDQDRTRRGRPAVWTLCGIAQAINAGDLMHTLAILSALESSPAAAACLLRASQEMIEGQGMDLEFESRSVAPSEYIEMIDRKTGALLRCAFELGGIAAGADDQDRAALVDLGRSVGRAFQIKDDLLGIWGRDDVLGKATGSDIRRRKKSLPIVLLFDRVDAEVAERLTQAYAPTPDAEMPDADVSWVVDQLNATDVRGTCEEMVQTHLDEASARLAKLPLAAEATSDMTDLIGFLARRES